MIVWFALLIPLVAVWVLRKWWPHRTVWWEYALPFVVCALLIGGMKACTEAQQVQSTEYWGSIGVEARYYEDWNEYIHQTCSSTCCCDNNGQNCQTTYYDCSYVEYHAAYWEVRTNIGEVIGVKEADYKRLKGLWNNEQFKDMRRNYHTDDGDMYRVRWPGDSVRMEPVTTVHTYENRVKAADASIFHFRTITDGRADSLGLFDYPPVTWPYRQRVVLGVEDLKADSALQHWNAMLGPGKEVRIFLLVFTGKAREYGQLQEWYWKGGNMNEVVVCIGRDTSGTVQWCHPISWGRDHRLQAEIRQHVEAMDSLDVVATARWLGPTVLEHFERRDFKEFSYLTVEPPTWAVVMIYLVTLLVTVLLVAFAVMNELDPFEATRRW